MKPPYIHAQGLTVRYGDVPVLDKVEFACTEGEFVCIVGKSGTGKSTFLNALAGFVPSSGLIAMPESVGFVFQDHALFPWMTVAQNIAFGLNGLDRRRRINRVQKMLERIGMTGYQDRYPNQLSGGQIQRVAFARALAPDPAVLLMDEPYGALDHQTRERMQDWLLSVWKDTAKTVLFVTHYIEEAVFLADRIVVLKNEGFVANIPVPFPRPRLTEIRFDERFLAVKHEVLEYMED